MSASESASESTIHPYPIREGEDRLRDAQNRCSGFDYMRLALAVGVIAWHCESICYGSHGRGFWYDVLAPFSRMILPFFFTLSGFLVAGSLERSRSLVSFLGLRLMRLLPALAVEVTLSALVLGPLLTTLPLKEYFTHKDFSSYFLNIAGDIHYTLPGLFATNPKHAVNLQLWTVPGELCCYVLLTVLAIYNVFSKRKRLLVLFAACLLLEFEYFLYGIHDIHELVDEKWLVMSFLAGLVMFQYYDAILWSKARCWRMAALSLLLLVIPNGVLIATVPLAYVTVYLGLKNPPRSKILLSGDYSYGMYLYGYPVQQAMVAISPVFKIWYWNLIVSLPVIAALAVGSWWLIERPVFKLRPKLMRLEQYYMDFVAKIPKPLLKR